MRPGSGWRIVESIAWKLRAMLIKNGAAISCGFTGQGHGCWPGCELRKVADIVCKTRLPNSVVGLYASRFALVATPSKRRRVVLPSIRAMTAGWWVEMSASAAVRRVQSLVGEVQRSSTFFANELPRSFARG